MTAHDSLAEVLESIARTRFADCYQCGKCTAGCPRASVMDMGPAKLIRMVQIGRAEEALKSEAIWQCVSCETCTARCPKRVDCAAIMDALRNEAYRRGVASDKQAPVILFQKAFLDNIRRNGRLDEIELIAQFKISGFAATRSPRFLFKDASLGLKLQTRKKLHLRGEKVRDRGVVRRIFDRCQNGSA
jgi:heterodisulfide reductase subunit C